MFFSTFPIWRQSLNFLKDVFLLQLSSFTLLVSLLNFFGISDRCHAIALSHYFSVFEELHATCKYFSLLAESHHFIHCFPCSMKTYFRKLNTATTALDFTAPETTLSLSTL